MFARFDLFLKGRGLLFPSGAGSSGGVAAFRMIDTGKDGGDTVIVGLLDWIEFVIEAAGAIHCETKKGGGRGVDDVVEVVGALLARGGQIRIADGVVRAGDEEAGRNVDRSVTRREDIAGELLLNEAVEGQVAVESVDDVVAEGPGIGPDVVLLVAVRFTVADDVEPVAAPSFAVGGRSKEAVDQLFIGVF